MNRKKAIQLIHIAKDQLGWSDCLYRDNIEAWTKQRSCKSLPLSKLFEVLQHLNACGFKIRAKPKNAPKTQRKLSADNQAKKMRSLWLQLHDEGVVRDSSESALGHWVKRQTDIEDLHWLSTEQKQTCIESLKGWLARIKRQQLKARD
ncbi:MAG: regulatory protein GemA [Oceanospirillaceae bacterium]|nr:regulatory protein GemA [Oceanospirillaceae bacterium]